MGSKHAKKIFLAPKPPPTIESKFANRDEYQLGSLSHFINARANGYQDLPEYPEIPPDPKVRAVEVAKPPPETAWSRRDQISKSSKSKSKSVTKEKGFYDSDEGHKQKKDESESSSDSES